MRDIREFVNNLTSDETESAYNIASNIQSRCEKETPDSVIHFLMYQNALLEYKIQKIITFLEEEMKK